MHTDLVRENLEDSGMISKDVNGFQIQDYLDVGALIWICAILVWIPSHFNLGLSILKDVSEFMEIHGRFMVGPYDLLHF